MRTLHINGPGFPLLDLENGTAVPETEVLQAFPTKNLPPVDGVVIVRPFLSPDPTIVQWDALRSLVSSILEQQGKATPVALMPSWPEGPALERFRESAATFLPTASVVRVRVLRSVGDLSSLREGVPVFEQLPVVVAAGMESKIKTRPERVTCPVTRYAETVSYQGGAVPRMEPGSCAYVICDSEAGTFVEGPAFTPKYTSFKEVHLSKFIEGLQKGSTERERPGTMSCEAEIDVAEVLKTVMASAGADPETAEKAAEAYRRNDITEYMRAPQATNQE